MPLANTPFNDISQSNEFLTKGRENIESFRATVGNDVGGLTESIIKTIKIHSKALGDHMAPWKNEQIKKVWSHAKEEYLNEMLKTMRANNFREQVELFDNIQSEIQLDRQVKDDICIHVDTERIRKNIEDLINQAQKKLLSKIKGAAT